MIRLDKYLADMGVGTRSQVKGLIGQGKVQVDGVPCARPEQKVEPGISVVTLDGKPIAYRRYYYYVLNKPAGVVTAREDRKDKTVLDVVQEAGLICPAFSELSPVGRLDKDTEGMLLLTNDGALAHRLLAPGRHVQKTYYAEVNGEMNEEDVARFRAGIVFSDFVALPAELRILQCGQGRSMVEIKIEEGKFHQIKRMVQAVGKEVTYLKRTAMGELLLPAELQPGQWRELTEEEVRLLC